MAGSSEWKLLLMLQYMNSRLHTLLEEFLIGEINQIAVHIELVVLKSALCPTDPVVL
jgi:hypothetical protein